MTIRSISVNCLAFPAAVLCLSLAAPSALAAERLSLANGFDVDCDHHQVADGRVRVFLKPSTVDYFELKEAEIRAVEILPDPPAEVLEAVPSKPVVGADIGLTSADLHELLAKAGSEHHVDADLLASVVKAESGGNARATSRTGAQGLMQLMPGTARELGVSDSYAPEENVRGGTAYLDGLLTRYRDNIALALAAYNAGPQAVDRYRGIPPYRETRLYVARVIHEFNRRIAMRKPNRTGAE